MQRRLRILFVVFLAATFAACASSGGGASYPAGYSAPPAANKLAKIHVGMSDVDVRRILGEPDHSNNYMTGKAWIPFYYGTDTARSDWRYKGRGRVVFSRNQYSGALKVIRVMYNPKEP